MEKESIMDVDVRIQETEIAGYTAYVVLPPKDEDIKQVGVFVPGAFHNEKSFSELMRSLAEQGFACYALNIPRGRWTRASKMVERVLEFSTAVSELYPDDMLMFLTGHSMGGYVSLKMLEVSNMFDKVILLAPIGLGLPTLMVVVGLARKYPSEVFWTLATLSLAPLRVLFQKAGLFSPSYPNDLRQKYWEECVDDSESFFALLDTGLLNAVNARAVRERGVPMLIIGGEEDALLPSSLHEKLSKATGADYILLTGEGTGHNIMADSRWPEVKKLILSFLS